MGIKFVISLGKYAANFLTLLRLGAPILLFWPTTWTLAERMLWFVLLASTDLLDGFVARRWNKHFGRVYGMSSPIGKVLDPAVDKYATVSAIAFIYLERIVDQRIITMVVAGEVLILILCVGVFAIIALGIFKKGRRDDTKNCIPINIFREFKKVSTKEMKVNVFGKLKTMAYFLAAIFVWLGCVWPRELLVFAHSAMFFCGIVLWACSFISYAHHFYEWSEKYEYSGESFGEAV